MSNQLGRAAGASSATDAGPRPTDGGSPRAGVAFDWHRVDLGFVSAYLLVDGDGDGVVVVDSGVEGSAPDIEEALTQLDLGWDAVEHDGDAQVAALVQRL